MENRQVGNHSCLGRYLDQRQKILRNQTQKTTFDNQQTWQSNEPIAFRHQNKKHDLEQ